MQELKRLLPAMGIEGSREQGFWSNQQAQAAHVQGEKLRVVAAQKASGTSGIYGWSRTESANSHQSDCMNWVARDPKTIDAALSTCDSSCRTMRAVA